MEKINKSKSAVKSKITRLEKYFEALDTDISLQELKVKLKNIESLQNKIELLRSEYYTIEMEADELQKIEKDMESCEDRLEKMEVRVNILIDSCEKSNSVNKVKNIEIDSNEKFDIKMKIPPLVLPEFYGKYEEFSAFKEQFDDLITNNTELSQSQKLYYLRSCLKNEAKNLATNFDSFESLYDSLQTRYDNERLVVDIHVQAILNFEKIQTENAKEIRNMIDCVQKNLRALNVLKFEQNKLSDIILINILVQKLDKESRKNFELSHNNKSVPTFDEFIKFLENRETVLLSINRNVPSANKNNINKSFPASNKSKAFLINENKNKSCILCKNNYHPIYRCDTFLKSSIDERLKLIRYHKLCELCFKQNHKKYQCVSNFKCTCGSRHNKLICLSHNDQMSSISSPLVTAEQNKKKEKSFESSEEKITQLNASVLSNNSRCLEQKRKSILFSTASIYVECANKQRLKIRCILDSASNICVLSEKISDYLGIKREKIKTPVSGLNGLSQNIKLKLNTFISNEDLSFNEPVEFLIVEKVTGLTPCSKLDVSNVKIPEFLELADKSFYEASEVDALISADIFFKVLKHNTYKINDELFFKESEFGWIACGKLNEIQSNANLQCFFAKNESLQDTMRLFFDLEGIGIRDDPGLHEKDQAMEIFNETVKFKNGRYIVQLPFKKSYKELADNYFIAKHRFQILWRKFCHNPEFHRKYGEIIRDYIDQGIIEVVKIDVNKNESERPVYYMPHQAVIKEGRVTSKTRIVFDAGSHQNNELSLNDCLYAGINLNPNLLDILINFRLNKVAFCSDIKQAFLQICLADEHKDAVRFLWSDDESCAYRKPKIEVYRFNRVNFGVSSSPFLLAATIRHHLQKFKDDYPDTVELLDSCFYVDDFISGSNNVEEALEISRSARKIMEAAGMSLRKWISNDATLMEQWVNENFDIYPINIDTAFNLGSDQTKILGMSWNTYEDYLTMDIRSLMEFISLGKSTKRFILQGVGKTFDPLGLITPFTIRVKCLIQDLWQEKIPWDEDVPPDIEREWKKWCTELPLLEHLKIPRLALDSTSKEDIVEIHSFCDASKKAYGAVVYLRVKTPQGISVRLLTSKSRVAPLKGVTLPRLELLGALVAARLVSKVRKIVTRSSAEYYWTDSKIVLYWITGTKTRWKQFVGNRVNEITSLTNPNSWHHCAGKENPADLLSRGISADCLVNNSKWWTGPENLMHPEFPDNLQIAVKEIESLSDCERETLLKEKKNVPENDSSRKTVLLTDDSGTIIYKLLENFNNYFKINHILCFIYRFIFNCKNREKRVGPLTLEEVKEAETALVKHAQRPFHEKKGLTSNITNLSPFVDEKGIIRVGGRVENASVPYSQKHPPILPKGSKLSKIYFETLHRRLFHTGPQGLLNAVRLKFWPLSGRNLARQTVHKCVTCFKKKPVLSSQIMGNLPSERVNVSPPFSITGVDLCGPYLLKYKNQRKGILNKIYICVCICFSTKAIHLELLSDLTSDALIATLKRFVSRRGKCSKIYTDNATNFVGSDSKLKKIYKLINFPDETLANYFTSESMDWHFIPPKSPHFGGIWEAGVKSVKHHLKRTIGDFHFTYEEFETIVIQVEGILNSRPLTPLSSDSDNFEVLTPGHFLIGRPITAIPEPLLTDINDNRLSRWQKTTKVVGLIWKKWKLDYLNTLQAKSKWMIEKNNVMIGQMVLVKEDSMPINTWLLGRITEVYHGTDGKVRVVKIRTKSGEIKRTINKIAILPIEV